MTIPSQLKMRSFINELKDQSHHPPGGDQIIAACYKALIEELKDKKKYALMEKILSNRSFTATHFVNLLFRTIQYIEISIMKNKSYPENLATSQEWIKELNIIFEKYSDILKETLLSKDTTTTIYQRYAGIKILLNILFPNKDLKVADFGCGGNFGLPGLDQDIKFEKISDGTSTKLVNQLINKKLSIKEGIGIDKDNPYNPDSRIWRLACTFYPTELSKLNDHLILESKMNANKKIQFMQMDLTKVKIGNRKFSDKKFDAIILSTFLYQLSKKNRKKVIDFASTLLSNNGVLIVQDFAEPDPKNKNDIVFFSNWFSISYPYKTLVKGNLTGWEYKEVLRWKNGRCEYYKKGKDFEFISNLHAN